MAAGGLGLLLLGMALMTDGLKAAAGDRLQGFLQNGTATRTRAACSGFAITALVQSSSAVVVALLGFTNAGMLSLRKAAWVVFGSNLGTTMTAWLVAFVGLKFNIGMLAWPLIGIGMLLRTLRPGRHSGEVGLAITGFGVLFVGIDTLSASFSQLVEVVPIERFTLTGPLGVLLALFVGLVLTALVQSSSAAIAIVLTASASGIFSPLAGAAVVIGANLGTTITALLVTLGATANAKRLAAVHVMMNLITGGVALLLLAPLWWLANQFSKVDGLVDLATGLAAFHTLFNLLGLLLMGLVAERIITRAKQMFPVPALRSGKPHYLDSTVMQVPAMALKALQNEQQRVFAQQLMRLRQLLQPAVAADGAAADVATGQLLLVIEAYADKLNRQPLSSKQALMLTTLHGVGYHLRDLRLLLEQLEQQPASKHQSYLSAPMQQALLALLADVSSAPHRVEQQHQLQAIVSQREQLRNDIMQGLASGRLNAPQATARLQLISMWRRASELLVACAKVLHAVVD
jgi:phosphate:Na+ symporter